MKKIIIYIALSIFSISAAVSQTQVSRDVYGSAGNDGENIGNMNVTYTIGEPVITTETVSGNIYTQGFLQPQRKPLGGGISYEVINETCPGASNGSITLIVDSAICPPPYTVAWDDGDTGMVRNNIKAGTYIFTLSGQSNCTHIDTVVVGVDSDEPCEIVIYSGFTPNNDGVNDIWYIENIDVYQPNSVNIFNRWGVKVWGAENYDNKEVVWNGSSSDGQPLPDGTYFYVIKANDKTYKSWVQITH